MPEIRRTTASVAASSTDENAWSGERFGVAPYPRTVKALAVAIQDNTPALGDMTWELYAGQQLIGQGRGILAQTTGGEFRFPEDYSPIDMVIPANVQLVLRLTNADAGGAHSSLYSLLIEPI